MHPHHKHQRYSRHNHPSVSLTAGLGLGIAAIYSAILGDMYTRAIVNVVPFATGAWETVGRNAAAAR